MSDSENSAPPLTLYEAARSAMRIEIDRYLRLSISTDGFVKSPVDAELSSEDVALLAVGVGLAPSAPLQQVCAEIARKPAVPFDVESSVTHGVYRESRPFAVKLYEQAREMTDGWTEFSGEVIRSNPQTLPVLQHVGGVFSKAALKKEVGSVSDRSISAPAAERLAVLLSRKVDAAQISQQNILVRIESTLEGIVRDLVGRVLLEEVVAHALETEGVSFMREEEYSALSGVVYDFRADFVIPDPVNPVAFIEVRKSSSRHASLYAKDKMFSAINWKGKHRNLIGVVVTEGDWTQATLQTMGKVFDYVLPLSKSKALAAAMRRACEGDESVLKWLIEFSISASPRHGAPGK